MAKKTKSRRTRGSDDDSDSDVQTSIASDSTLFSDSVHESAVEASLEDLDTELTNIMEKRQETREKGLVRLCAGLHAPRLDWLSDNREAVTSSVLRSFTKGSAEEAELALKVMVPVLLAFVEMGEGSALIKQWLPSLRNAARLSEHEAIRSRSLQLLALMCVVADDNKFWSSIIELCTLVFSEDPPPSPSLVAVALHCWGVVVGLLPADTVASEHFTGAVHIFAQLLEEDQVDVRIASGANLALLSDVMKHAQDSSETVEDTVPRLPDLLAELKRECTKKHSKKDRARQRSVFRAVETTLGGGDSPSEKLVLEGACVHVQGWPSLFVLDLLRTSLRSGFQLHVGGYESLQSALGVRIEKQPILSLDERDQIRHQTAQIVKARANLRQKNRRKKNEYASHHDDSD